MIKITGTAYITRKDVKAIRQGLGGEKAMHLRLKNNTDDKEFYIATLKAKEDDAIFDMFNVGDKVDVEGAWIIRRNKQSDGSFRYYNVIYLDSIEPAN
jgi:hypothetical protein